MYLDGLNGHLQTQFMRQHGLLPRYPIYFIAGTIFWFRWSSFVDALSQYNRMEMGYFGNGQPTYTHMWERIFGILLPLSNYTQPRLDANWYRNYYPDLRHMNSKQAVQHWKNHGIHEKRFPNQKESEKYQ